MSSPSLKEEMAHYERALPDSEDKTYAYLYKVYGGGSSSTVSRATDGP